MKYFLLITVGLSCIRSILTLLRSARKSTAYSIGSFFSCLMLIISFCHLILQF